MTIAAIIPTIKAKQPANTDELVINRTARTLSDLCETWKKYSLGRVYPFGVPRRQGLNGGEAGSPLHGESASLEA